MPETKSAEEANAVQPAPVSPAVTEAKPKALDLSGLDDQSLRVLVAEIVKQTREQDQKASTALVETPAAGVPAEHTQLGPGARFMVRMLDVPRNKFVKPILESIAKNGVEYASKTGLTLAATFTLQAIRPHDPLQNIAVGTMVGTMGAKVAEPVAKAMVEFGDYILGKGIDAIQKHEDGRAEKLKAVEQAKLAEAAPQQALPAPDNLVVMPNPAPAAPKPASIKLRA